MKRHLLWGFSLFAGAVLMIAGAAALWSSDHSATHSSFRSQIPTLLPIATIEPNGSVAELRVAEVSAGSIHEENVQRLAAAVVGRISPLFVDANETASGTGSLSGFRHDWPAVYESARFTGDKLLMAFDDGLNRYRVTFDGVGGPAVLITRPERRAFVVSGLGLGEHEVRIEKISESPGIGGLLGLFVPGDGDALAPPQPLSRQIEFIGDSDSVGYGNLSTTRNCDEGEVFELTDTQTSFGPQIARHFGADYQLVAASGIGVLRNYAGSDPDRTMPTLYRLQLRNEPDFYQSSAWAPQIIVLALGSNDFQSPIAPDEPWIDQDSLREAFVARYSQFLKDVRSRNGTAFLLLVMWPQYGSDYIQAHEAVLEAMRSAGDPRIDLIALPKMSRAACDWHPTLEDHRKAFEGITRYIEMHPEIWSFRSFVER